MIVNNSNANIDLRKKYKNVVWLSQTVKPRNVTTYTNWLDSGILPVKTKKNKYTDFEVCIEMLIKGSSKEECEITMSKLLNDFDSGELELDDMQFIYDFDFKSEEKEIVKRWLYSYKINLTAYSKKGMQQTINFTGQEKSFNCGGTSVSPATLTITSGIALASLTIEGLTDEAITIKDINRNSKLILDAEKCVVTENDINILEKTDLWEFPKVVPGINTIKLSTDCIVQIQYRPHYK